MDLEEKVKKIKDDAKREQFQKFMPILKSIDKFSSGRLMMSTVHIQ